MGRSPNRVRDRSEYFKEWSKRNLEKRKAYMRARYLADPEKAKKRARAWAAANPEKKKAFDKKSRKKLQGSRQE